MNLTRLVKVTKISAILEVDRECNKISKGYQTILTSLLYLKGHGNEADFLGFLHKSVRHRSLTLHFEPFRF